MSKFVKAIKVLFCAFVLLGWYGAIDTMLDQEDEIKELKRQRVNAAFAEFEQNP